MKRSVKEGKLDSHMEGIKFRPISFSDYHQLFDFWNSIDGLAMHNDYSESPAGFKMFLERNPNLSLVAKDQNKIIGAVLCSHDGRRGYLNHLAVSPEYRDKGIGKQLVLISLNSLGNQNIHKTMVPILKSNLEGQRFWIRIGFAKEDIIEMHSITH